MEERKFVRLFLLLPSILVLYFVYKIFQPFLMAIFLATILATLCYPGYKLVLGLVKQRANLAAMLSCLVITAMIIVPCVLLILSLAGQARQVYERFKLASETGELQKLMDVQNQPYLGPVLEYVGEYVEIDSREVIGRLTDVAQKVSGFFINQTAAVVSGVVHVVASFFIMIICMFFLFRDGSAMVALLQSWTPLSESYERLITETFQSVASATVLGSLLTAVAQGIAGGLVFWILGLPNALLWGSMMALFSLVPVVGTGIVWVPWAIFLVATGSYVRAIILTAAAVLFVGMIDNVLRPLLIEGKAKMHTMLVFFSIMGGIGYFGIIGMLIGPIIVALGLTFLELYKIEYRLELGRKEKLVSPGKGEPDPDAPELPEAGSEPPSSRPF